jgi:hypothetical protein
MFEKPLTVKDLLAILNTLPPELPVVIDGAYLGDIAHLSAVSQNVGLLPDFDSKEVCVLELDCLDGNGQAMGPREIAAYLSRFF